MIFQSELGKDFRAIDNYTNVYQSEVTVTVPQNSELFNTGYLRCKFLHPVGPNISISIVSGGATASWLQTLPVMSPCRYPMEAGPKGANDMHADGTILSSFGSGHCTHACKVSHFLIVQCFHIDVPLQVREGSMWFQVEMGRNMLIQDVSVENRGNCCGKGDDLINVRVAVNSE